MAKTKIELFEEKLIEEGVTDENLLEFEKLLKRAGNDWSRIDHCCTTAYYLPVDRLDEAVKLIEFGIDRYGSDKNGFVRSYQMLGFIYWEVGLYQKAYEAYVYIYPHLLNDKGNFPWCLLNTKMHADKFSYSPEIEDYLVLCQQESEFAKSFIDNKFMMVLADYIIAGHYGNTSKKEEAYSSIKDMLAADYTGPLRDLLKKHKYDERLRLTDECKAFLESIATE